MDGSFSTNLIGLDEFSFSRLELLDGELDREKLATGKYILEGVWSDTRGNLDESIRCLLENKGHTMERSQLLDIIWTDGADYVDENALSVTVKRLRDKLEDVPSSPKYIKTVYGIGYTWAVT